LSAAHRLTLRTTLTPAECCARLKAKCASWSELIASGFTMQLDPERPVWGRVTERGFRLFARIRYRNGYQTCAKGRFAADGSGTRVDVRFGITTIALVITGVWTAVVVAVLIGGLIALLMGSLLGGSWPWAVVVPGGMLAFMVALVKFCRWLARDEERILSELITRELEAGASPAVAPIE
jgi:hypothetical protein